MGSEEHPLSMFDDPVRMHWLTLQFGGDPTHVTIGGAGFVMEQ